MCIDRRDHRSMTAALRDLHWLPIALRIEFKVLTLMHGSVHNSTPLYLSDRISTYTPARTLRSESQSLAVVPRINLERYGRREVLMRRSHPVECAAIKPAKAARPGPF